MNARFVHLFSMDGDDLSGYVPTDSRNFCLAMRLIAGPAGGEGEESFDFRVCTPDWLSASLTSGEIRLLRHILLVDEYNYSKTYRFVSDFVESCTGEGWDVIAEKLSRLGYWEFEDYVDFTPRS
ncbi:MAG TPA: immunity 8 family protein [Candidatus Kapabacteria bacterium]|jgi:hypothetical protein|nr:immunity 8 family protein [Candidatus Kapabacteria bacterium]HVK37708.1 immunity 8 family protein [Candidatus Kapabacteria bacterium]